MSENKILDTMWDDNLKRRKNELVFIEIRCFSKYFLRVSVFCVPYWGQKWGKINI